MDSTILNNANVYAVNSNEIFQYSPKRKIEIINKDNELSPYDKNFTYLVTFHPISPYSQDQTNNDHLSPNDIKCPNDILINNEDYHYLNNDAFDQWFDSTESFYPILSYDTTCKYDNTSLITSDFFNIFSLFIYKNKIHQVINDSTNSPALVHCSINLPDIKEQYHKYYHVILTRNDNIYTMHLILDRFGLFSTYDPEYIFRLSNERNNISVNEIPQDITNIENDSVDNTAFINLNEEYTIDLHTVNVDKVNLTIRKKDQSAQTTENFNLGIYEVGDEELLKGKINSLHRDSALSFRIHMMVLFDKKLVSGKTVKLEIESSDEEKITNDEFSGIWLILESRHVVSKKGYAYSHLVLGKSTMKISSDHTAP